MAKTKPIRKRRIGMIGEGNVGSALKKGLTKAGHDVRSVGKVPEKVAEVGEWADVVFLAVPYWERENAVEELGESIRGKTLIDVTNAIEPSYEFAHDLSTSGAEELQEMAHGARVVKAFNSVFAQNMSTGRVNGEPLSVLVAGDEAEPKEEVIGLAEDIGFQPVDAGPLENARWLEALGYFNIKLGYDLKYGTDIGLKVVGAPNHPPQGPEPPSP